MPVPPDLVKIPVPTSGKEVIIRANKYDPNQWTVTVYNWDKTATVLLTLPLGVGDRYELRDVENYMAVLIQGVYEAGVSVPMTGPVDPGMGLKHVAVHTPNQFGVFILTRLP